jgi:hypothetical protein
MNGKQLAAVPDEFLAVPTSESKEAPENKSR